MISSNRRFAFPVVQQTSLSQPSSSIVQTPTFQYLTLGVTSVQDENPELPNAIISCDFHRNWPSSNCCLGPRRRKNAGVTRFNSGHDKVNTISTYHQVEIPFGSPRNIVVTEVDSVPVHNGTGIISKVVDKLNRGTKFHVPRTEGSNHTKSLHGEDAEGRASWADPKEVVVSYDVWRTIEEKTEDS